MKYIIITLFPEMFAGPVDESILSRARQKKLIEIEFINLRDFGLGERRQVDDTPYGGGPGMILKVDVVASALAAAKSKAKNKKTRVILLTPQGEIFNQKKAGVLSGYECLILICGHYEGFDERIRGLVDEELSIGQYVLTGGEIPAMVVVDTVSRLIPGILGKKESVFDESFSEDTILEYPQYTKPQNWQGQEVPPVLTGGNHAEIKRFRKEKAAEKSQKRVAESEKER